MIKNLKMTLNYDTGTWWLTCSPPTRYQIETSPHTLPKPIIENTTSNRKKASKTSKEDSNKISENKINCGNKIEISNETTEIRNKNSWINFRNRAILLNNIGGRRIKQVESKNNATEVCEGIV